MDDMTAFERQVTEEILRIVGPTRSVDRRAVFEAAASTPNGWVRSLFGATKLAVAAVVVALFGGFLFAAQPSERVAVTKPAAQTGDPIAPRASPPPMWESAWVFHPEGELESGWYMAIVDGYPFGYWLPAGWSSGGPGDLGGYLTKDGVTVRMSSPDAVYSDPCEHTLGPPLGSSTDDLANALMAIPGTEASGPTDVPIAQDYFDDWGIRTTAKHVVLTIPEDAPCGPGEYGFYLWRTGDGKGVPRSGPRWVEALGSTINVWVWKQENRSNFNRILIDAETMGALSPEIEREIHEIFASIQYPGG
jgi:hypothetical protein